MKKTINLLIVIVALVLVAALCFSIFTFIVKFGDSFGDSGDNPSDEKLNQIDSSKSVWTIEDGDFKLLCIHYEKTNVVWIGIALQGLEPGEYTIQWSFKSNVFDTGAHFIPATKDGVSGYSTYFYNDAFEYRDSKNKMYAFSEKDDYFLKRSYSFDVTEVGAFGFELFEVNDVSKEVGGSIRDYIMANCIDYIVVTKVG